MMGVQSGLAVLGRIQHGWRPAWRRFCATLGAWENVLVPPRCARCDADLAPAADGILLCAECRGELAPQAAVRCLRCASAVQGRNEPPADCHSCRNRKLAFERVWTLGDYGGSLRDSVLRMKHHRDEPLSAAVGGLLWQRVGAELAAWRPDVAVPVPMHWLRRWLQGTNSPEVLAGTLAGELGLRTAPAALVRRRRTPRQSGLSPQARLLNVRGAFRPARSASLDDARVLLVDDVLTTGATCSEAARVLRRAGAAAVAVAVAARTPAAGPAGPTR